MIRFPLAKILNAFEEYSGKTDSIPVEQAVFSVENKQAKMTALVNENSVLTEAAKRNSAIWN